MDHGSNSTPNSTTTWEQRLPEPVVRLVRWLVDRGVAGAAASAAVIMALAASVALTAWLLTPGEAPPEKPVEDPCEVALAELDNEHWQLVRAMAWKLSDLSALAPEKWGVPGFLLGVATAKEAELSSDPAQRRKQCMIAAKYLQESQDRGYPAGREAEASFWLAHCLVVSQRYTASLPALRAAYELNAPRRHELFPFLAEAHLGARPPQPKEALIWSDRHLANKLLARDEREAGLVQRANILVALDKVAEARAALAEVPAESPSRADALLATARALIREAQLGDPAATPGDAPPAAAHAARTQAMKLLHQVVALTRPPHRAHHIAAYLIAQAMWQDRDLPAAAAQFARVRRTSSGEPEGLAAAFAEADVAAQRALDQAAADLYLLAFQLAGETEIAENPWLAPADVETRSLAGFRKFLIAERHDLAQKLAESFPAAVPRWRQQQLLAETHRAWAEKLLAGAASLKDLDATRQRDEAYRHYQAAAQAYGRSARERMATREYPDDVWASADCYWLGRGYRQALAALDQFLEGGPGSRAPEALVRMADVHLALGQTEQCLATIRRALQEYPQHPVIYRARLLAAQASEQEGKLEEARRWLLENLEHEHLTPKSLEWRDSLFGLGRLLYQEGTLLDAQVRVTKIDQTSIEERAAAAVKLEQSHHLLVDATRRLAEAVDRYPDAPQRWEAEYLLAEAHRLAARLPREKVSAATVETTRHGFADEMKRQLLSAIERYAALQTRLNERQHLSTAEQRMLRNCYFAQGGAWFDLGEYRKAIDAYSTATNLYQNDPASLEAYVQIANCYRRMQRPFDARAMVEQAKTVLKNMPQEAKFDATTRFSREEWVRLLDWMAAL